MSHILQANKHNIDLKDQFTLKLSLNEISMKVSALFYISSEILCEVITVLILTGKPKVDMLYHMIMLHSLEMNQRLRTSLLPCSSYLDSFSTCPA